MAFVHKIRQVQLVGPKIRQLRKERKMTQTELASRIGIQQSDLSRMEKGEYRVSLDTLFKILAESNVSIGEFFEDVHREALSPAEMQMIGEFKELAPEDRREVRAFINFKRQQTRRAAEKAAKTPAPGDDAGAEKPSEPLRATLDFERSRAAG